MFANLIFQLSKSQTLRRRADNATVKCGSYRFFFLYIQEDDNYLEVFTNMKLKIVGSGGMFQIPNPFCKCPICEEARVKRGRYERLGPSIYIEDIKMLIDTPEDLGVACDRQGICK